MAEPAASGAGEPPVIELRNVSKSFGEVRSLSGVNFKVNRREIVGLLGDNLAPVDLEIDPRERPHLSKRFGDVPEFDDRRFAGAGCRRLRHPASG